MVTRLTYGSGLGEGLSSLGASIAGAVKERTKRKQLQDILNPPQVDWSKDEGIREKLSNDKEFSSKYLGMVQDFENESGQTLNPKQLDMIWNAQLQKAQVASQASSGGRRRFSTQQLGAISDINPKLAQIFQQDQIAQDQMGERRSLASEKRAYESNKPFMEDVRKIRRSIHSREMNQMRMQEVLGSDNLSSIRNFSADYLGNKGFSSEYLSSASANELKSVVKDEFVRDLQMLPGGTKLNQLIERNLITALQSPLKTPENNQMITEAQRFKLDLDKKQVEVTDSLLDVYERAGREPPANLEREVDKRMKKYTQEKQKDLTQIFKDIKGGKIKSRGFQAMEIAKQRVANQRPAAGSIWMLSPEGEVKQVPRSMVKQAQDAGGRLIK